KTADWIPISASYGGRSSDGLQRFQTARVSQARTAKMIRNWPNMGDPIPNRARLRWSFLLPPLPVGGRRKRKRRIVTPERACHYAGSTAQILQLKCHAPKA